MSYLIPTVLEKSAQGERAMDLYSRLMRDRIVMLTGEVNDDSANIIVGQMLFLESEDPEKDILFYINSPGGIITSGMAILDTMRYVSCDVSTIVIGQACSMGSLLASSGEKGKRFILPNAVHMIHQPLGGARGQASDIEIHAKEIIRLKESLTQIYAENTGRPLKKLSKDMDRDNFMTAEQSVVYGLADRVITHREINKTL